MTSLSIVAHQLTRPYVPVDIYLPEHGTSSPHLPSTDNVKLEYPLGFFPANDSTEIGIERIDVETGNAFLHNLIGNE